MAHLKLENLGDYELESRNLPLPQKLTSPLIVYQERIEMDQNDTFLHPKRFARGFAFVNNLSGQILDFSWASDDSLRASVNRVFEFVLTNTS